jgi:hypothetical protein
MVAASTDMGAHRKDEYLQAARIALHPEDARISLDLTAGIAVADIVLTEIDRDRNGTISEEEARAYAEVVRRAIALDLDGRPLALDLIDSHFPSIESIRKGEGAISLELSAIIPALPAGAHHLRYRNTHHADIGAYLANVLAPENPRVAIAAQKRDVDQRQLVVDYVLTGDPSTIGASRFLPDVVGALLMCAALWWRQRRRRGQP